MEGKMKKWQPNPVIVDLTPVPPDQPQSPSVEHSLKWMETARHFLDRLLVLPAPAYWSTMASREEVMQWTDAVVDSFPRPYESEKWRSIAPHENLVKETRVLRGCVLTLMMRLATYDKKGYATVIPQRDWVELVFGNGNAHNPHPGLLSLLRLSRWTGVFAPPHDYRNPRNRKLLARVLDLAASAEESRVREELIVVEGQHIEELRQLESDVVRLTTGWDTKDKRAQAAVIAESLLKGTVEWLYSSCAFYRVVREAKLKVRSTKIVNGVASSVESLLCFLTTERTMDIAVALEGYPLRRMLRLRTQLEQFAVELVHDLQEMMGDEDKKKESIKEIIKWERFACIFNERYSIEKSLSNEEKEKLRGVVDRQLKATMVDMHRLGLLKNLGDVTRVPAEVASSIDHILQMVPQFSVHFVHGCLRHCGYDMDVTTDMMLSGYAPLWLTRLETAGRLVRAAEEAATTANGMPPLPPIVFDHEEYDLSALYVPTTSATGNGEKREEKRGKEEDTKNMFKGLFSITPTSAAESSKAASDDAASSGSDAERKAATAKALAKIKEAFQRLSMRSQGEGYAFGMEEERLVEMANSKVYARTDKYKTKEQDKIALRPFYDKYKYETDEKDEDVYNDEYDDGYEDKAFSAEHMLNDVASSDEEKAKEEKKQEEERKEKERGNGMRGRGGGGGGGGGQRGGTRGGRPPADNNRQEGPPAYLREPTGQERGGGGGGEQQNSRGGGSGAYTGGRQRQMQEKNKNKFRQRGADRKAARGMF